MRFTTLLLSSAAFGMLAISPAAAEAPAPQTPPATCGQPATPAPGACNGQRPDVQNSQTQTNNAYSQFELQAGDIAEASGAAVSSANIATVGAQGARGVAVRSQQDAFGSTTSRSTMTVNTATDNVINSSTATANGLTAGTSGGQMAVDATQVVHPGADVNSTSYTSSRQVGGAANTAAAAGNVATLNAENAGIDARIVQNAAANIRATAEADHCCVNTAATGTAVASANNITAASRGGSSTISTDQRSSSGEVVALVDLYVGFAGDVLGNATANGNAVTVGGAFAPLTMDATQVNGSAVRAQSFVTVGGDVTGVASANSYGVGNSAVGQNAGGNGRFITDQTNNGSVTSYTGVTSSGGVGATGSSTAIGNMASGFVCTACGDASLVANNRQVNNGAIVAATGMTVGNSGTVIGSATAIGNSATYTIRSGH
jgi:hypothetical protein